MKRKYRIVTRGRDGSLRMQDYSSEKKLISDYSQIGVDDYNTDLSMRGLPILRGLVGPLLDGAEAVRYESPDVFQQMTKELAMSAPKRRRQSSSNDMEIAQ